MDIEASCMVTIISNSISRPGPVCQEALKCKFVSIPNSTKNSPDFRGGTLGTVGDPRWWFCAPQTTAGRGGCELESIGTEQKFSQQGNGIGPDSCQHTRRLQPALPAGAGTSPLPCPFSLSEFLVNPDGFDFTLRGATWPPAGLRTCLFTARPKMIKNTIKPSKFMSLYLQTDTESARAHGNCFHGARQEKAEPRNARHESPFAYDLFLKLCRGPAALQHGSRSTRASSERMPNGHTLCGASSLCLRWLAVRGLCAAGRRRTP